MALQVPQEVHDLDSFAELLSWAMAVWGDAEGGLLGVVRRTATGATAEVTLSKGVDKIELDFGSLPSSVHAQWFLRVGLLTAKGQLGGVDADSTRLAIDTRMNGYKSADSAKDWYWGTTCGEEYFGYFCDALGLPPEVQAYLRDRYSRFEFRKRPKRFATISFNREKVQRAVSASSPFLQAFPPKDRLKTPQADGSPPHPETPHSSAVTLPVPGGAGSSDRARRWPVTDGRVGEVEVENQVGMDPWTLGAESVLDSVVVDATICDSQGVDLDSVVVTSLGPLNQVGTHPAFVEESKSRIPVPIPNRPKVHLVDWQAPINDQGNVLTLEIAKSDYWTSQATQTSVSRIQDAVVRGEIDLMLLPRRLDVHLVVVTGDDNRVLLARRGTHVATEPGTWMVSVGESMDWDRDRQQAGAPHPSVTARHCLTERDELNLPREVAERADFRLVAVATEWTEMLANLIVVARLPGFTFEAAAQNFRRGENVRLDAVDFTVEGCAPLLRSKEFAGSSGRWPAHPVSDISRAALVSALQHAYPGALHLAAVTHD